MKKFENFWKMQGQINTKEEARRMRFIEVSSNSIEIISLQTFMEIQILLLKHLTLIIAREIIEGMTITTGIHISRRRLGGLQG